MNIPSHPTPASTAPVISPLDRLSADQRALFAAWDDWGITTTTYDHAPVFTVAESDYLKDFIPGIHCRSLLLTNKTNGFWLVSAADETVIDLKYLATTLDTPRFSFAKPDQMTALLRVTPGSLTPFAALFDTDCVVSVILDPQVAQAGPVVFHPLINTQSTVMDGLDLVTFLTRAGHPPHIRPLSVAPAA